MASVTYSCNSCGNFWYRQRGDKCPECGSRSVSLDWDEQYDFSPGVVDVQEDYDELEPGEKFYDGE